MKAQVDKETCIGCGLCEQTCPEVFKMTDDIAIVIKDPVPPDSENICRETAEDCPVEAISITE